MREIVTTNMVPRFQFYAPINMRKVLDLSSNLELTRKQFSRRN